MRLATGLRACALVVALIAPTPAGAESNTDSSAVAAPAAADTAAVLRRSSAWTWSLDGAIGIPLGPEVYRELYDPGLGLGLSVRRPLLGALGLHARGDYVNLPYDAGDSIVNQYQLYAASEGALHWVSALAGIDVTLVSWLRAHARAGYGIGWGRSFERFDLAAGRVDVFNPDRDGVSYGAGLACPFRVGGHGGFVEVDWLALAGAGDVAHRLAIRAGASVP